MRFAPAELQFLWRRRGAEPDLPCPGDAYDDFGRVASETEGNGVTVSYTYDNDDRLLTTSFGQGGLVKYQNGSATSHIYNDPTTGQPVLLTTFGDVDALYIDEGLGNIAGLTTDDSSASVRTAYDPYGASTLNGSAAANTSTQNPYAFKNGVVDQATGLVKFGARWYNTLTGTWTQRDTLDSPLDPHNADRYVFAAGDPINGSDPSGNFSPSSGDSTFFGGCIAGAGGVAFLVSLRHPRLPVFPLSWRRLVDA